MIAVSSLLLSSVIHTRFPDGSDAGRAVELRTCDCGLLSQRFVMAGGRLHVIQPARVLVGVARGLWSLFGRVALPSLIETNTHTHTHKHTHTHTYTHTRSLSRFPSSTLILSLSLSLLPLHSPSLLPPPSPFSPSPPPSHTASALKSIPRGHLTPHVCGTLTTPLRPPTSLHSHRGPTSSSDCRF